MYDVALMKMTYIIGLPILFVSNKVRDDLQKTISAFTKSKSKYLQLYMEPMDCIKCKSCTPLFFFWHHKHLLLTNSCPSAHLVHVIALPAHISSDNGLIGMIQIGKVFVGVLAMHFHT
jgi:hypothetical protein